MLRRPISYLGRPVLGLLAGVLRAAELLVWPSSCRLCGRLLERPGERVVCAACLDTLEPRRTSYCVRCGRFFDGRAAPHLCRDCLASRPLYSRHRSGAPYQGNLRQVIILMKYEGFRVLGRDLAAFALRALGDQWPLWAGLDAIVPVPLHGKKLKRRGFNQAEIVARAIGRVKGIPVRRGVLVRVRNTPAQTSLEGRDRRRNLAGAFAVRRPGWVRGKTLLLVDDVYTTGSTIRECCRALRRAGAEEVRAMTLARTSGGRS
jgi:competence protein ComFC